MQLEYGGDDDDTVLQATSIRDVGVEMGGLNHGLVLQIKSDEEDGYIYASSDTTVYRWSFDFSNVDAVAGNAETVIVNMNANGNGGAPKGHWTRTLAIDDSNQYLYISVGSEGNIDPTSYRSRIRRFGMESIENALAGGSTIDFQTGEVFADGLRNEVGLTFDRSGVLWGVENSADNLMRSDLGGDIHNDNPAEELNRFPIDQSGLNFGYISINRAPL